MDNEFILRWLAEWGKDKWVQGTEVEKVFGVSSSYRIDQVREGYLDYKDMRVGGNTSHYKLTDKAIQQLSERNQNG